MEQARRNNNGSYSDSSNQYNIDNNDHYINSDLNNDLDNNINKQFNNNQNRNQRQNGNQNGNENPNSNRPNNNTSQSRGKNTTVSQEEMEFLQANAPELLALLRQSVGGSRRISGSVSRTENYLNELRQFSSTLSSITTASSQGVTREEFGKAINYLYGAIVKESANNQLIINQLKQVSAQLQAFATSVNQINQRVNTNQIGNIASANITGKAQEADSNFIEIPLPKIGKVKVDVKFIKPALIGAFFIFTVLVLLIRR